MARVGKEVRLQDRAARARLASGHHPHWRSISEGCHLGYYRGARTTKWVARFRKTGTVVPYEMLTLGETDDRAAANGTTILDWKQALAAATEWFELKERGGTVDPRKLTVRFALDEYIAMRDARESAHAGRTMRSNASQRLKLHIFNDAELIDRPLSKVTEDDFRRWLSRLPPSKITSKKRLASDFKAALNMTFARHRSVLPPDLPITIRYGLQVSTEDAPAESLAREGQILTDAQVRRVIELAYEQDESGDLGRMIVLLAATGARFSQIRKMRVQDVQIEHSRVMVPKSRKGRGKGGGHIRVPVGTDVLVALRPILRDRPGADLLLERWAWKRVGYNRFERGAREPWMASWQITHGWKAVAIAAGVPDAVAYSLRHSSIVRGLREGLPIRLVAGLHDTSVDMIEKHYSAWITEGLDELAARAVVPLVAARA